MQIKLSSLMVDDQDKALKFYTEVLGFIKKQDVPVGEFKWLTVVSPEGPDDIEMLLEPNENPAAQVFQKAMYDQSIPMRVLAVDDIQGEYDRMKKLGVHFSQEPIAMGPVTIAQFDDTCGNLIQIASMS